MKYMYHLINATYGYIDSILVHTIISSKTISCNNLIMLRISSILPKWAVGMKTWRKAYATM